MDERYSTYAKHKCNYAVFFPRMTSNTFRFERIGRAIAQVQPGH